jgi:hypothetical protein
MSYNTRLGIEIISLKASGRRDGNSSLSKAPSKFGGE